MLQVNVNEQDFIFYNNLASPDQSVVHTGDNRTGAGDGDDEKILVNLKQVSPQIEKFVVTVTIYDAERTSSKLRASLKCLCTIDERRVGIRGIALRFR